MKNWRETIQSEYDHSPRLLSLIKAFDDQVDPEAVIDAFFAKVFDPRTATGWGLDVWGRRVDIGRVIQLDGNPCAFGFKGSDLQPFGQGPFYSATASNSYQLADEAYRKLIFFKAAINITDGSLPSLNRIMHAMFKDRGTVMVLHTGTMKIRFYFDFYLKPHEEALIRREDVPPKPAGVGFDVYQVRRSETFGFAGSGLQPFHHGNFVIKGPQDAYTPNP